MNTRNLTARSWRQARQRERMDVYTELGEAAASGSRAAAAGEPEEAAREAAGYASDSAQGITWTQAYRLTLDRLNDWTDENPQPEEPTQ